MINECIDKIIEDFKELKTELSMYESRVDYLEDQFKNQKRKREYFTNEIIDVINRYNNDNMY